MMHRGWGYRRSVRENLKQNDNPTSMFSRLWDIEWARPGMGLRVSKVRTSPQTFFHSQSQPKPNEKPQYERWVVCGRKMSSPNVFFSSAILLLQVGKQSVSLLHFWSRQSGEAPSLQQCLDLSFWDLVQLASDLLPSTILGQWNQLIGSGFQKAARLRWQRCGWLLLLLLLWRLRYLSVHWHLRRHSGNCSDHPLLELVQLLLSGLFSCSCFGFLLSTLFVLLFLFLESAKLLQLFFAGTGRRRGWVRTGASSVGSDSMGGTTAMTWAPWGVICMLIESLLQHSGTIQMVTKTMNTLLGHNVAQNEATGQRQIFDTQAYQCIWAPHGVVDVSTRYEGGPKTKLGVPCATIAHLLSFVAIAQIFQEKGFSKKVSQQPKEVEETLASTGFQHKVLCNLPYRPAKEYVPLKLFSKLTLYMH